MGPGVKKCVWFLCVFVGIWVFLRFLLPLCLPFLLGLGIALLAEPLVKALHGPGRLPRGAASALGVSVVILVLCMLVLAVLGFLLREMGLLAGILPDLEATVSGGITLLRDWLLFLAGRCPPGLRGVVQQHVTELFSQGTAMLSRVSRYILGILGTILTRVPESVLGFGAAVLSAFMLSARLPKLCSRIPAQMQQRLRRVQRRFRETAGQWMLSQLKLAGVTCLVLTGGFALLRIAYAPLLGVLVAMVDAFPVLGSGTVLLPWSLVCLLRGDGPRAAGLLGLYITAAVLRSVLEPKLVGRQLGLDPLVTLLALYVGYRLWGLGGMLLMPLAAATAVQLAAMEEA